MIIIIGYISYNYNEDNNYKNNDDDDDDDDDDVNFLYE